MSNQAVTAIYPPKSCGGCQSLELAKAPTVTLLSGSVVCNTCPAWQAECAERHRDVVRVLALPDIDRRHSYLDAYGQQYGAEALERLKAAILYTHSLRKKARIEAEAAAAGAVGVGA